MIRASTLTLLYTTAFIFSTISSASSVSTNFPEIYVPQQVYIQPTKPIVARNLTRRLSELDNQQIALKYITKESPYSVVTWKVRLSYTSDHNFITHVYVQASNNNNEIKHLTGNFNLDFNGNIIVASHTLFGATRVVGRPLHNRAVSVPEVPIFSPEAFAVPQVPIISPESAVSEFAKRLNITVSGLKFNNGTVSGSFGDFAVKDIPIAVKYYFDSVKLHLVYDFTVEQRDHW
jgi:hypothetical protein